MREKGKTAGVRRNRKESLNRIRGTRRVYDPEKGPENK